MTECFASRLFESRLGELPIANRRLCEWQMDAHREVAELGGLRRLDLDANIFVTPSFAHALGRAAGQHDRVTPVVPHNGLHEEFGPNALVATAGPDGLGYGISVRAGRGGQLRQVPITHIESFGVVPQPGRLSSPLLIPQGRQAIWGIGHWADLLVANLLAVQAIVSGAEQTRVAATADIHPSAVVEASTIGPGTRVGPFAVIRNSQIGADCVIEEHTSVNGSVLDDHVIVQTGALVSGSSVGANTVLSFQTATRSSVLFGSTTVSCPVLARSVVGPDVFIGRGVQIGASTIAEGSVRLRHHERSVGSGLRLLGAVIGTGARIGGGLTLPPGYEVPAHYYLVDRPIPRIEHHHRPHAPIVHNNGKFRQLGFPERSPIS